LFDTSNQSGSVTPEDARVERSSPRPSPRSLRTFATTATEVIRSTRSIPRVGGSEPLRRRNHVACLWQKCGSANVPHRGLHGSIRVSRSTMASEVVRASESRWATVRVDDGSVEGPGNDALPGGEGPDSVTPDPPGRTGATPAGIVPGVQCLRGLDPQLEAADRVVESIVGHAEMLGPQAEAKLPSESARTISSPGRIRRFAFVRLLVQDRDRQLRIVRPRSEVHVVGPDDGDHIVDDDDLRMYVDRVGALVLQRS